MNAGTADPASSEAAGSPALSAVVVHRQLDGLRVAGLGLLERWRAVLGDAGLPVTVVAPELLAAALDDQGPVLLIEGDAVVSPMALRGLAAVSCPASAALIPALSDTTVAVRLGSQARRRAAAAGVRSVADVVAALAPQKVDVPDPFWMRVSSPEDARRATSELLHRIRHRPGGNVARHVNRPVSIRITRILLGTRITPNGITTVTGVVGLLGAIAVAIGYTVTGLAVLQLSSILDGVDGEIARAKHLHSAFGAWYDSVMDEIVNASMFLAVGWNLAAATGTGLHLALGCLTGGTSLLYALFHWHCRARHGHGFYWWWDLDRPPIAIQTDTSWSTFLKRLFWRDTYVLLYLVAGIAGLLPWMLGMSAAGAVGTLGLFAWHIGVKRARW